jgi:hypothetical protein
MLSQERYKLKSLPRSLFQPDLVATGLTIYHCCEWRGVCHPVASAHRNLAVLRRRQTGRDNVREQEKLAHMCFYSKTPCRHATKQPYTTLAVEIDGRATQRLLSCYAEPTPFPPDMPSACEECRLGLAYAINLASVGLLQWSCFLLLRTCHSPTVSRGASLVSQLP